MIVYKFDGTKNGLLTCLFESFTKKEMPFLVTSGYFEQSFDMEVKTIVTDEKNAERVSLGIKKCGGISLLNRLFYVFRSMDGQKENAVFRVAYKCLNLRRDESYNYADADVLYFFDLYQKINTERHRFLGFARFMETESGVLYAPIEPDNDIVDLIAPHFIRRLAISFIIHDTKRNVAVISDGKKFTKFTPPTPLKVYLSANEEEIEEFWKKYYQSVNIVERKNIRQMLGYMPMRYAKKMIETQNLSSSLFENKKNGKN